MFNLIVGAAFAEEPECDAAPAVASRLLDDANIGGRLKGYYVSLVAIQMEEDATFNGVDKCDIEAYEYEIASFLIAAGANVTLPGYKIGDIGPAGGFIF